MLSLRMTAVLSCGGKLLGERIHVYRHKGRAKSAAKNSKVNKLPIERDISIKHAKTVPESISDSMN